MRRIDAFLPAGLGSDLVGAGAQRTEQGASEAARTFGFSRPSFYQAKSAFDEEGLFGLVPKKRGPRGGHKLTEEVLKFSRQAMEEEGPLGSQQLTEKIWQRFGVRVHRRTVERALGK